MGRQVLEEDDEDDFTVFGVDVQLRLDHSLLDSPLDCYSEVRQQETEVRH